MIPIRSASGNDALGARSVNTTWFAPAARDADLPPEVRARLLVLEVLQHMEREQHVVGGERLAVGPLDAGAQRERVGEVIRRDRPVAREQPDHVLLRVDGGQPLVDDAVDVARRRVVLSNSGFRTPGAPTSASTAVPPRAGFGHRGDRLAAARATTAASAAAAASG